MGQIGGPNGGAWLGEPGRGRAWRRAEGPRARASETGVGEPFCEFMERTAAGHALFADTVHTLIHAETRYPRPGPYDPTDTKITSPYFRILFIRRAATRERLRQDLR